MAFNQAATVVVTITIILGTLAIVAVALRLYCRRVFQKSAFGADDYCVMIALFLSTGLDILTDYTASTTRVSDTSYVPTTDTVIFTLKAIFGAENAQIAAMGFVKISLLLYYKRIFISRFFLMASNILIGLIICFTLASLLTIIFSKWPVYDQWNPEVPFNINISVALIFYVTGNTFLDLLTLILPLAAVQSLHISAHRKLVLSIIFSFGSCCIVASLFRLYYAVQYTKVTPSAISFFQVPFVYNSLWAVIEPPVFIIAGCLLTLGPLYRSKYGPGGLFKSLRSLLASSKRSVKVSSANPNQTLETGEHVWRRLHEPSKGNNSTHRAEWELNSTDKIEPSQRSQSTSMV